MRSAIRKRSKAPAMRNPLDVLRLYPEHDYTLYGAFESRRSAKPDARS
jgi:hypothetical protein